MKNMVKNLIKHSILLVLSFTIICGVFYTGVVTAISNTIFNNQSNGSIIEVDGVKYGSSLMGQYYNDENHMWGRIMNVSASTFTDKDGNKLMYSGPSNISPASDDYEKLIDERVKMIKKYHSDMADTKVPVDLVTCSGSGLDPDISLAAANYQIKRLAKYNNISESEVKNIIDKCTNKPALGFLGETTVNVLKVNLMLEGIIK